MSHYDSRIAALEAQMKQLLDDAAKPQGVDGLGVANIGRALLYAELYERVEWMKRKQNEVKVEPL